MFSGLVFKAFLPLRFRCLCLSTGKGSRGTLGNPNQLAPARPWEALPLARASSAPRSFITLCSTSGCTPWPPLQTPHQHTSRGLRRSVLQTTRGQSCLSARKATTNGEMLLTEPFFKAFFLFLFFGGEGDKSKLSNCNVKIITFSLYSVQMISLSPLFFTCTW